MAGEGERTWRARVETLERGSRGRQKPSSDAAGCVTLANLLDFPEPQCLSLFFSSKFFFNCGNIYIHKTYHLYHFKCILQWFEIYP